MAKNKFFEVMNNLRGAYGIEEYTSVFITTYYLSRKLNKLTIDEILDRFDDENIKFQLKSIYESKDNQLEQFKLIDDFTLEETIEFIGEISEYSGRSGGGEFISVKSIIDLSLRLLDLDKEDTLLDVGSGIGTTLLSASNLSNVVGIEININSYELSCLLFDLYELPTTNLVNNDVLRYDLNKLKANKVFMNMPLGMRISPSKLDEVLEAKFQDSVYKNLIRPVDASWAFALDVIENTKYEKFVMLVNGSPLYSDAHQEIRKVLINNGNVESVIALPANLLPYTSIPVYLIVFSHNNKNINFVDATELYSTSKYRNVLTENHVEEIINSLDKKTKISKSIHIKKMEEEDFTLDPLRYTVPEFPFKESLQLKDVLVTINRGHNITKKDLDKMTSEQPTNYQYLMLQNFQEGIIDDQLPYLNKLDETYDRYLLKDNSIIISRLAPFKIGSVDKLKNNVLANGNLFFIEVDESKVDKNFLTAYLQSRIGLREIEKYMKGSTMKTINLRDLEKIRIPKLSIDEQKEIGNQFLLLNAEYKAIRKRTDEILNERYNIFEGGIWCFWIMN